MVSEKLICLVKFKLTVISLIVGEEEPGTAIAERFMVILHNNQS